MTKTFNAYINFIVNVERREGRRPHWRGKVSKFLAEISRELTIGRVHSAFAVMASRLNQPYSVAKSGKGVVRKTLRRQNCYIGVPSIVETCACLPIGARNTPMSAGQRASETSSKYT